MLLPKTKAHRRGFPRRPWICGRKLTPSTDLGRDAGTRGLGKGREQVREIDQIVGDRPFRRLALPTDDQRHFGSAVRYQSFASGNGTAQIRMGDVLRRSIVAGEQYDRFFAQLHFIELLE